MTLGKAQALRVDPALVESFSNVSYLASAVTVSLMLDVPVFPCKPDKRPYIKDNLNQATIDP